LDVKDKHENDNLLVSSSLDKEICVTSNDVSIRKDGPLQNKKLDRLPDSEEVNGSICQDVEVFAELSSTSHRACNTPCKIPEIRITESSLPCPSVALLKSLILI